MRHKIRNQLLFTYIFLTIIPLMVISIYMINVYSDSIIETEEEVLLRHQNIIHKNIESALTQNLYMMDFLQKDKQIQSTLLNNDHDNTSISTLLNGYVRQVDHVIAVTIFDDQNVVSSYELHDQDDIKIDEDVIKELSMISLEKTYSRLMVEDVIVRVYRPGQGPINYELANYVDTIHLFSNLVSDGVVVGTINVMISPELFEKSVLNVDLGDGGYFYITNSNGDLLYSPVASNELNKEGQYGYLTVHNTISNSDWELYVVRPIDKVLLRINSLRNNIIILFIITLVIMIVITTVFSNSLVAPINKLLILMKLVEKGNLDVSYQDKVKNEFHDLGIGFNKMLSRINILIEQVKEEQQSKKTIEIAMLQSNIKPHFLYNTLETIRWMSKKYDATDISDTVNALATFFRVGLSKGKEMITLNEELLHVKSYLQIQKTRYSDILNYEIKGLEGDTNIYVPKVIIQPFVENAIYHGIKESGLEGKIIISVEEVDNNVRINIEDNGSGMSKDRLKKIMNEMNKSSEKTYESYGVKNVHQRIELIYGKPFGVSIISNKGVGTRVTLTIPKEMED